jgi:Tfp pilus assembly protein PilO
MPQNDDFATELRGDMQRILNKRDPVALAVGVINLVAIIGGWAWYGGRLDQRVSSLEETRRQERETASAKVNLDAVQTVQIAELQKDVKYMRETLDRIDRKIPERAR